MIWRREQKQSGSMAKCLHLTENAKKLIMLSCKLANALPLACFMTTLTNRELRMCSPPNKAKETERPTKWFSSPNIYLCLRTLIVRLIFLCLLMLYLLLLHKYIKNTKLMMYFLQYEHMET